MPKVDKQQLAFDAVRRGNISEVKKTFGKKLSFGIINSSGQTPLHIACSEGHYLVVQWLTNDKKKIDIDAKDRDGWTPLHCACHSDHIEIVDHLIARNADVCKETSNGSSAMDYFVRMPSQSSRPALFERLFRTMIRKGVNVNKQNASLETPLHKAAFRGKDQSVSLLLWNQADPNIKNKYGETALHLAAGASCINVVKKLIDAKADCTISGSRGNVFDIAKKSGNPDIVRLFESILGAPINSKTSPETTPTVQKTTPPQPNTQPTEPTQPTVSQPQTNVPSAYGAPKQPLVTRDDLNRHKPVGVTLEKQRSQTTVTPIPVNVPTYLQNTGDYSSWNIGSPTTGGKTGTNPTGATIGTSAYGAGQPTATGSFAPYTQPSGKYGSVGVTGYASLTSGYMTPPKEEAPTPTPNLTTQPSYLQFDNQPKKTAQPVTPTPVQPVTPVKEEPKPEPTPVIEEPKTEPIKHKKDTKRNTKRNTRKQEAPKTEPIKKKEPEKPKNLENYTLGDCIGTGAFGKVYRGLDCRTGALVAIKQVSLSGIPDSELASIMSELELLQKLEYKYIVQYIGFIRTDEHLNIITELIEGGSLSTIMKRFGKAQEPLCARYVAQTLLGLDYLHRRGVVHRDIKSGNILVTKDGIIKLADFGIAAVSDAQNADEKMATLRDVAKHKDQAPNTDAVGSPYWMAPEVIQMMGASSNSDIWSLGCTVIELLTGDPPYINLPPMSALFAMVSDSSPPLPDTISSELREFFGLCFKKDPKERPSARDLLTHPWIVNNVGDMSSELSGRATSGNSTPKPTKKTQPKREASPPPLEPPVVEAPKQPPTPVQPITPTPVQPVQPVIQTPVQPVTPTPVQPPVQPVVQPNIQPNGNMPMQTPEEILKNLNAAFPGGNNAGMTLTGIPTLSNVMENLNMLQSAFAGAGITPHGVNPMANPMANPMMNPMMTQGNPYANIQMPSGREILAQPEVEKEESEESEEESEETMLENQYQKDARAIKEYMTWIKLAMKGGRGDRAASIRKALRKALKQIRIRHGKRQDARELAKDARALIREVEDTFPDNIGIDSSDSDYDSEDSFFLESDGEEDDIYF